MLIAEILFSHCRFSGLASAKVEKPSVIAPLRQRVIDPWKQFIFDPIKVLAGGVIFILSLL